MRWHNQRLWIFVFGAGLIASVPLRAQPIVWQLVGLTFSDGATASGTFAYDAASGLYDAWNISVTPGIFTAYDYQPGVDNGFLGVHSASQVDFVAFPASTSGRYMRLAFVSPLTSAGQTDLLRTDNSGYECNNCTIHRDISGGDVTSVPEPANLALASVALALAGVAWVRLREIRP